MHYGIRAMGAMTLRNLELCPSFSPHPNISDGNLNLVHQFFLDYKFTHRSKIWECFIGIGISPTVSNILPNICRKKNGRLQKALGATKVTSQHEHGLFRVKSICCYKMVSIMSTLTGDVQALGKLKLNAQPA